MFSLLSHLALVGTLLGSLSAKPQDLTTHIDDPVDLTDAGIAFVEYETDRDLVYVGERVPVRLRFGFEETALKEQLIQLFVRRLDVPVLVEAPWFDAPQRADVPRPWITTPVTSGTAPLNFALNGELIATQRITSEVRNGKTYTVLELERDILPTRTPDLLVERARLRFARGTRFRESLLDGRVAEDRQDAVVIGNDLLLRVEQPPTAGQPARFDGRIGTYQVEARAEPNRVTFGASFEWVLHVTGTGELAAWVPPRLSFRDFRILGEREIASTSGRRIGYTLEPLSSAAREVPPVELVHFDPTPPASYRVLRTAAIPIQIDPGPEVMVEPQPNTNEQRTADAPPVLPLVLVVVVGTVSMVLVLRRRRSVSARATQLGPSPHSIGESARREHAGDVTAAFQTCVRTLLESAPNATAGTSISSRLNAAGLRADLANRAGELSERIDARKFGNAHDDDLDTHLDAWLEALASSAD